MKIITKYLSLQEIGKRSNQEDSIYPRLDEHIEGNDLFVLCDGMGGHECGEVASQAVCETLSLYILEHPDTDLESALAAAYNRLDELDNDAEKKMGTTMTLVKFDNDSCIVAHIGDSRVYQIRPSEKRVVYVTRDHSLVNDLIACGELTQEEAKHSSQKNVITRAMQSHQDKRAKAEVAILSNIKVGDYFYMCSDGMLEISDDSDIVNVLSMDKTDEQKLEILRGVTKDNNDNHSAHLIHVVGIESDSERPLPSKHKNQECKRNSNYRNKKKIIAILAVLSILIISAVLFSRKVQNNGQDIERTFSTEEVVAPAPSKALRKAISLTKEHKDDIIILSDTIRTDKALTDTTWHIDN